LNFSISNSNSISGSIQTQSIQVSDFQVNHLAIVNFKLDQSI
jgi:hypothetical protein